METILDVINAVDEKFSSEDKWIKGAYAKKSKFGMVVSELHPEATCWCLDGAVMCVSPTEASIQRASLGGTIANKIGTDTLIYLTRKIRNIYGCVEMRNVWNDASERTFQDIKNLLAECKKELSQNAYV